MTEEGNIFPITVACIWVERHLHAPFRLMEGKSKGEIHHT